VGSIKNCKPKPCSLAIKLLFVVMGLIGVKYTNFQVTLRYLSRQAVKQ